MRRRLLTYTLPAALAGLILWACQRDRFGHDDPNAVEPTLTVGEARDFFEYQFSEMLPYMTKAEGDMPVGMMPGDFTPLWDKARIGANREMDGADVPIDPKFIFVAVFNRITEKGDTVRQTVDITQKLVVKKWRNTEEYEAFCYIASIVPTPEYYARHRNVARDFQYAGSKGEFSGFVIYRTLDDWPVAIDNYRDGRLVRHDYFPQITEQNLDSISQVMALAMETTEIQAGTPQAYIEDGETIVSEEVTVPGHKHDFPDRPGGLPTDPPKDPIDWPDYGGNTGGGGGGGGNHSGSLSVPPIQEKDCGGQAGENAASAQMMYGAFNNAGLQEFIDANSYKTNETGAALNFNSQTGQYEMVVAPEGTTGHITIPTIYGDVQNTVALYHSHPASGQPHSITDVEGLVKANVDTKGKTTTSIVTVRQDSGTPIIYAIQIEDATAANNFAKTLDSQLKNQISSELQDVFSKILQAGGGMDESYAYAMSHLLSKYNTGVRIMKYENGGFKQKEASVSGNTITRSTCK